MKIKFLVGALVFLIIVNLAVIGTFVAMHVSRTPPPEKYGMRATAPEGERQLRRPRIPKEHRKELMAHLRELREDTAPLREQIAGLEDQMFAAIQMEPVPEALIDSLLGEISTVQYEIRKVATGKLLEAKEFLPPEHQEMFFRAMLNARRGHMGMHGTRGDGPRHGRRSRIIQFPKLAGQLFDEVGVCREIDCRDGQCLFEVSL